MSRYLSLLTYTEKGLRDIRDSSQRAASFRAAVQRAGGKVLALFWAVGAFDGCVIFEAPDEATAASLLLNLGHAGNVRLQTLRLYDETEFAPILETL